MSDTKQGAFAVVVKDPETCGFLLVIGKYRLSYLSYEWMAEERAKEINAAYAERVEGMVRVADSLATALREVSSQYHDDIQDCLDSLGVPAALDAYEEMRKEFQGGGK